MSGNKMTDTKISEDLNLDSGFHSGSNLAYEYSGELRPKSEGQKQKSTDESSKVCHDGKVFPDSGVVEDVLCDLAESEVLPDSGLVDDVICDLAESDVLPDSGLVDDVICDLADNFCEVKLIDYSTTTASPASMRAQAKDLPLELLFQQDDDGDTQLHIAAVHGYEKPVSTLIRVCPNKELLNLCNESGHTALHLAVMSGNAVITRMLVLAGADIGIRDRRGETPLHKATALSNVKCIQALLMPVLQNLQRKMSHVLNQKNYNGQACVHVAAALGHIESLQALLFYGADINSRENLAGWTALHIAASRGASRLVQYIQRCSGVDARVCDYAGRTPRRLARWNQAAALFIKHDDSDTDDESDDDIFDEETESLFEKYSNQNQSIVA